MENKLKEMCKENKIKELVKNMQENNKSICQDCMDKEELKKNLNRFNMIFDGEVNEYYYMFDTGTCDTCKKINEIIYLPLQKFLYENRNIEVFNWYTYASRERTALSKRLILRNLELNVLTKEEVVFLENNSKRNL